MRPTRRRPSRRFSSRSASLRFAIQLSSAWWRISLRVAVIALCSSAAGTEPGPPTGSPGPEIVETAEGPPAMRSTADSGKRRCPPAVTRTSISPLSAHLRTVAGCTPSRSAASDSVRRRSFIGVGGLGDYSGSAAEKVSRNCAMLYTTCYLSYTIFRNVSKAPTRRLAKYTESHRTRTWVPASPFRLLPAGERPALRGSGAGRSSFFPGPPAGRRAGASAVYCAANRPAPR